MVKKLERKSKAGIRVESTPREGTEAGKAKDWLSRGLPLLKGWLESDPRGWKRVLKLSGHMGAQLGHCSITSGPGYAPRSPCYIELTSWRFGKFLTVTHACSWEFVHSSYVELFWNLCTSHR